MQVEENIDRSSAVSKAIKSLKENLTASQKRKMAGMSVLIFLSALCDVFGLASILPLVKLASNPMSLHKNKYLEYL